MPILLLLCAFPMYGNQDVTFLLDIGSRILNGQLPYVGFFEVNLPPIFYLSAIPVLISQWSGTGVILVTHLLVFVLTLASAVSVDRLLVHAHHNHTLLLVNRIAVPIMYGLVTGIALLFGFGQREHLMMLAFVPWLLLRCLRLQTHTYPRLPALLLGVASAVAFTLKPHYVLMVIAIELVLLTRVRHWRLYFQPEMLGVLGVALVYVAYLLAFPQVIQTYINEIMPLASSGYDVLGSFTLFDLTWGDPLIRIWILLALVGVAAGTRRGANATLVQCCSLAAGGALIGFAVQGKGWPYHQIPVTWVNLWLVALLLSRLALLPMFRAILHRRKHLRQIVFAMGVIGTLGVLLVVLLLWSSAPYFKGDRAVIAAIQSYVSEDDGVVILDAHLSNVYPTLVQAGHWQGLHHYLTTGIMELAYFPALPEDIYLDTHVPGDAVQELLNGIIVSLNTPATRLLLIREGVSPFGNYQIDLYRYLLARPSIRTLLDSQYRYVETVSQFRIYVPVER
jgi:hypothetical protein